MRDFSYIYSHADTLEEQFLFEQDILWDTSLDDDDYKLGHGFGVIYGSVYNNPKGGGQADGFTYGGGAGEQVYPYQLIQYWE